jgi:hypothetical protein
MGERLSRQMVFAFFLKLLPAADSSDGETSAIKLTQHATCQEFGPIGPPPIS